jgi:hypothetical protein
MSAPLTNGQKRELSQLAERAYRFSAAKARGRGEEPDMTSAAMDAWRHDEVAKACGKLGLRCCSQLDYAAVKAHFMHVLGEDGKALHYHLRSASEQQRQLEHKITRLLGQLGRPMAYADSICRRMNKGTSLLDASADQLKQVLIALTYDSKRARRRAQGPGAHPS